MDRRICNEMTSSLEKKRRLSTEVENMEHSVSNLEKQQQAAAFAAFGPSVSAAAAGTPSPQSTSTLSSFTGSISPKRRYDFFSFVPFILFQSLFPGAIAHLRSCNHPLR